MGFLDHIFRTKKVSLQQAYEEAASTIEAFVEGRGGAWDWDDFISTSKPDGYLESVRDRCRSVSDDYPAKQKGRYCSDDGLGVLRALAREIRLKANHIQNSASNNLSETKASRLPRS